MLPDASVLDELREKAETARDETDCVQPRDWDALSPKDDAVEAMLCVIPRREWPVVILALLDRIEALEKDLESP